MAAAAKTLQHDDLVKAKPKDRLSRIVQEIVINSRRGFTNLAALHHEALMNSLGLSPSESFVTSYTPYGQRPYPFAAAFASRPLGQIVSPFTYEQVNAITTRMVTPLLGQREVIYVEPQGQEDILKCRVREVAWERTIRSPFTSWADLVWRTCRDVVVRSRAYWEVVPRFIQRRRRVYIYGDPMAMQKLVDAGLPPEEVAALAGTIRTSSVELVTLWDGPVITPLPFGCVHKDAFETIISESTLFVVKERVLPYQQFIREGERLFPKGSVVPFNRDSSAIGLDAHQRDPSYVGPENSDLAIGVGVEPSHLPPHIYEPVRYFEFRGIDPLDSTSELVAWITGGETVGCREHDGSGSVIDTVEWCWDPINGIAISSAPAMAIRTKQEQLSILGNCATNAALWDSNAAGGVNMDAVNNIEQVKNLRPMQFFPKQGDGAALEQIQLGKNSQGTLQFIRDEENSLRLATGGIASLVGGAPGGVDTLGEFNGITQGAMDRISTQVEINMDTALRRTFHLVIAAWRDCLASDDDLRQLLGFNEDVAQATLADLDGDLDAIPMATRYSATNKRTLDAISSIYQTAQNNPRLMARLKPEIDDDFVFAAAGPRAWRWVKSQAELMQQGVDPAALDQMNLQAAAQPGRPGTPSPPREQPANSAETAPLTPGPA